MLDSVASGKRLPEKNLIVLGGTPQTQRSFLETLSSEAPKRPQDRHRKKPPIANEFALGYTYQDVLDADHEDILARLSIYLMSDSSPVFSPLLRPLLTPQMIPQTLLVILLDWSEPWQWAKQLRRWISLIYSLLGSLEGEAEEVSDQIMKEWQQRRRGGTGYDTGGSTSSDANITLPMGEGEWDLPLGLPVSVVCHNSEKIASLEVDHHWKEEDFDFVLQSLRTVLLKHGASLVYTSGSAPNSLPTLIHSSLGIHSSLKKQALKHNVIDRDKILVPPNWDSFGKIRVLRDGFDVEKVSALWAKDLNLEQSYASNSNEMSVSDSKASEEAAKEGETVLSIFSSTISDPFRDRSRQPASSRNDIEVSAPSHQAFLASQSEVIERLKAEEADSGLSSTRDTSRSTTATAGTGTTDRMNDQIGPVQVNMGGIQVDAGDVLRRLKSGRENTASSPTVGASIRGGAGAGDRATSEDPGTPKSAMATPEREMKAQNEALNNFFTGLMKRGAGGSPRNTPTSDGGKKSTPREKSKEDGVRRLFGKE